MFNDKNTNLLDRLDVVTKRMKHYPGKHNQFDHAWNAGLVLTNKKRSPRSSPLSRMRKNKYNADAINRKVYGGINSPFEATRSASSQSRQLGSSDPIKLVAAVNKASTLFRKWADKFRSALAINDENLQKEVVAEFKKLSKELGEISNTLKDDPISQNIFNNIMQSYQDTTSFITPEIGKVLKKNNLTDKNTPDSAMAKRVENQIDKAQKVNNND
jgi:hypothetical protein